jgi:DNA mismatch repair protein MutS
LAGIPDDVVKRANELLQELEKRSVDSSKQATRKNSEMKDVSIAPQHELFITHLIHKELENLDIHQMTPLEALNTLAEMKEKLKLFRLENKKFLEVD